MEDRITHLVVKDENGDVHETLCVGSMYSVDTELDSDIMAIKEEDAAWNMGDNKKTHITPSPISNQKPHRELSDSQRPDTNCKRTRDCSISDSDSEDDSPKKEKILKDENFPMPPAEFQMTVVTLLRDIRNELRRLNKVVEGEPSEFQLERIETMEEFQKMEESLDDTDKRLLAVKRLSKVGGINVKNSVNDIMERLFTNSLLSEFNFAGTNRSGLLYKKKSFARTKLYKVINDAVLEVHTKATEVDVKQAIQKNLQNAPFRVGGGGKKN